MKIYVDMDGVLANFFKKANSLTEDPSIAWRNQEFRDVDRVLKKIRKTPNFFTSLDAFPQINTLLRGIKNLGGEFSILSSPLNDYTGDCAAEKKAWLDEHLIDDPENVIITHDKPQYAKGNILIDDYGFNCRKWEEAGGFAIKYQASEDKVADVLLILATLLKSPS